MSTQPDHLIYATNDLQRGAEEIARLLGVSVHPGGSHPGFGTRNAILPLGPRCYLEVIGPDPEQADFEGERLFGIDDLDHGKLVHWCVERDNLADFVARARSRGINVSDPVPMSRQTAEGTTLSWELAFPTRFGEPHPVPFFIDWGDSPHPASAFPQQVELVSFEVLHPQPEPVNDQLATLDIEPCVRRHPVAGFEAHLQTSSGVVVLR
jgi:hypothetical protein